MTVLSLTHTSLQYICYLHIGTTANKHVHCSSQF